jgi:hypothetical protein
MSFVSNGGVRAQSSGVFRVVALGRREGTKADIQGNGNRKFPTNRQQGAIAKRRYEGVGEVGR